jgi:hypothetical protein
MYIQVFGRHTTALPPGWGEEICLSVMSDNRVDATAEQGDGAKLTVVSILCSTRVLVPPGSTVQLSGGDILGSHTVDVEASSDGPLIKIQAIPVLGSIKIRSEGDKSAAG